MPEKFFQLSDLKGNPRPELEAVRKKIVDMLLILSSIVGFPAIVAGFIQAYQEDLAVFSVVYVLIYLMVLITACASGRLSVQWKALSLVTFIYLMGLAVLIRIGLSGIGLTFFIALCIFCSIFFNLKAGFLAVAIGMLTILTIGAGMVGGLIDTNAANMINSRSILAWVAAGSVFCFISIGLIIALEMFRSPLIDSLELLENNAAKLESSVRSLELQITARKKVEEALRQSEERFRNIAELLPETIYEMDAAGRITFVNHRAFDHFRYAPDDLAKGLDALDMLIPEDREKAVRNIQKILKGEDVGLSEYTALRKDKTTFPAMFHSTVVRKDGEAIGLRGFIIDITDRKNLEARLKQAEKMEAIGTLAGGVAHDLNNVLSGIVSYPDLFLMELPQDSPLIRSVMIMKKTGLRAAAIVQDLLTLARRGITQNKVVNLNDLISEHLKSPEHRQALSDHSRIKIETRLAGDLLNIRGSSVHLSKTVMNLIVNAVEAMPLGGEILLSTENRYIDKPVRGYDDIVAGDYVLLTITDSGVGLDPADKERIFEPFYTRKKMGKSGTGLGLAVVWGTVKDHKGYIDVESGKDRKTSFILYFPVTRDEMEAEAAPLSMESYQGKGESILVVDDFEDQRIISSGILTRLGYQVKTAAGGEEAVAHLRTNSVDLVVLDMIMEPGMDGLDTYKAILEVCPGQKAIIASGYSETQRVKEAQGLGAGAYVKKPYTVEKLGLAVRQALDRQTSAI